MEEYRSIDRVSAEVARLLMQEVPLDDLLVGIGQLAVAAIPDCDEAGVTLEENGKVRARRTTGTRIEAVDANQYEIGEGPCIEASRVRSSVLIEDMAADKRWPRFAEFAASFDVVSSFSIPMMQNDEVIGVLNLYSITKPFGSKDEAVGQIFAQEAAAAVRHAHTFVKTRELIDDLQRALESRSLIGTVVGLIMERNGQTMEHAFESLKEESQRSNIKLRNVAESYIEAFESNLASTSKPELAIGEQR
jgi:GAF domain-containing protein